jgi:ketosteroid isomerase-like protein
VTFFEGSLFTNSRFYFPSFKQDACKLKTMKNILIAALLIIAASVGAFSQKQTEPFEKTNADARVLVQYMTDWANLSNKKDAAALDKMLPDDLVITFQDGEVLTKTEYIATLKKNPGDFTITDYDQKVDLFNDKVAVIRARYVVAVGADVKLEFRYTVTFLKRKGRWEPVAFHSSPLVKK